MVLQMLLMVLYSSNACTPLQIHIYIHPVIYLYVYSYGVCICIYSVWYIVCSQFSFIVPCLLIGLCLRPLFDL